MCVRVVCFNKWLPLLLHIQTECRFGNTYQLFTSSTPLFFNALHYPTIVNFKWCSDLKLNHHRKRNAVCFSLSWTEKKRGRIKSAYIFALYCAIATVTIRSILHFSRFGSYTISNRCNTMATMHVLKCSFYSVEMNRLNDTTHHSQHYRSDAHHRHHHRRWCCCCSLHRHRFCRLNTLSKLHKRIETFFFFMFCCRNFNESEMMMVVWFIDFGWHQSRFVRVFGMRFRKQEINIQTPCPGIDYYCTQSEAHWQFMIYVAARCEWYFSVAVRFQLVRLCESIKI